MVATILVEGTVGVGKTSALERVAARRIGWHVHSEPLKTWQEFRTERSGEPIDLLRAYYSTPCTETLVRLQQQVVNASLVRRYHDSDLEMRSKPCPVRIFERSLRVAGEVFVESRRDLLDEVDASILKHMAKTLSDVFEKDAHHVYLFCDASTMLERVRSRDREAERNLTDDSLLALKDAMDEWARTRDFFAIDTTNCTPEEVAQTMIGWKAYSHVK